MKPGEARYSLLTNEEGGILDDLIVYRLESSVLVVANASNRDRVIGWLLEHKPPGAEAELHDRTAEWAMISIQGPQSVHILAPLVRLQELGSWDLLDYYRIARAEVLGRDVLISRTGYTGEDGFEIYHPSETSPEVWDAILEAGGARIAPIGLGARDTLRLEAGMPLYGNEIDETTSPFEAGLGFAVKLKKAAPFIGQASLAAARERGVTRRLVGFRGGLPEGGPPGHADLSDGERGGGRLPGAGGGGRRAGRGPRTPARGGGEGGVRHERDPLAHAGVPHRPRVPRLPRGRARRARGGHPGGTRPGDPRAPSVLLPHEEAERPSALRGAAERTRSSQNPEEQHGGPMARPDDLKYTATHEWLKVEGDVGTVGITDFAVEQLSDLVFVDLPSVGEAIERGVRFGEVESTKTVSDLISPVSGTVTEVNSGLTDHPEVITASPFEKGWLIRVRLSKPDEVKLLLSGADYERGLEAHDE